MKRPSVQAPRPPAEDDGSRRHYRKPVRAMMSAAEVHLRGGAVGAPRVAERPPSKPILRRKIKIRPEQSVVQAKVWPRPYLDIADTYARRAADPKNARSFCHWTRLSARRYLNDRLRARQPNAPFYFDEWHAQDPCEFVEGLPHVEGSWETNNILLHESDVFFLVNLFGFRRQDGTRRFTSALKAVARKNAKSTIAAAIGLYCLCCEGEVGGQVVSAATTGSQARIIFRIAQRMVEKTPALRVKYRLCAYANSIVCGQLQGAFKPINSKASTQDGLNPSCVLLDEIHAHKNHDLVNVLRSAAGARSNALFLFTTTEGYETPGPWPEMRQFAKQILEGVAIADHFLVCYYALDDAQGKEGQPGYIPADSEFDESTWIKANPLLDVNPILLTKIREEAIEAKRLAGRLPEFRIKRLNRPSASAGAFIFIPKWRQCASPPLDLKAPWLATTPCWGGLDLASTRDIASFRLVWLDNNIYSTHGWRFVPRNQVHNRSERGVVPYKAWIDQGLLIECGDEVLDYAMIEKCIIEQRNRFNIKSIGYDTWNAAQMAANLVHLRVPMEPFIQGPRSYHAAMKELEMAYSEQRLRTEDDPVLNWCAYNLQARTDVNNNMAPERKGAPDKIDDMVALLMAFGQCIKVDNKRGFQMFTVG